MRCARAGAQTPPRFGYTRRVCAFARRVCVVQDWEIHNASGTAMHPDADQVLLPTLVYRPRYADYVVVGGYRDAYYNDSTNASPRVWRLALDGGGGSAGDAMFDYWDEVTVLNSEALPVGRAYTYGVYDPVFDRVLMYGGLSCPPQYSINGTVVLPQCDSAVPSSLSMSTFHNDTLVLQFLNATAAEWQWFGMSLQANKAQYPPALGYSVATYNSDRQSMVIWGFWTSPTTLNPTLPMYSFDTYSLQWSVIPVSMACGNTPQPSTLDDWFAFVYNPAGRTYVLYMPSRRQVLVYNTYTTCWDAPIDAQVTAPDYRMHVAFAYIPYINSLLVHGGYFVSTVRENVYVLSLDTYNWDLPVSAQQNAPSRHKHSA